MGTILEILKLTIPGVIVFFTAFYSIKMFLKNDEQKRNEEYKNELTNKEIDYRIQTQNHTTPIKIQAFERLVLFLERINPESLLVRIQSAEMTAGQLHQDLLIAVRAEFEHNLSQQIFVSHKTWLAVKQAKEIMIKTINQEANKLSVNAPASALSEAILRNIIAQNENPIQLAIDILKIEASTFL